MEKKIRCNRCNEDLLINIDPSAHSFDKKPLNFFIQIHYDGTRALRIGFDKTGAIRSTDCYDISDKSEKMNKLPKFASDVPIILATDSASDLPLELVKSEKFSLIPSYIMLDEALYKSTYEITSDELLIAFENKVAITTSSPTPNDFAEAFNELNDGRPILYIHGTSKLIPQKRTITNATVGLQRIAESNQSNPPQVVFVDSLNVSAGLIILLLVAKELIQSENAKVSEVAQELLEIQSKIKTYFTVTDLSQLRARGAISGIKSFVAGIFGLKPILTIKEGEIKPAASKRGEVRAIQDMLKRIQDEFVETKPKIVVIVHFGKENEAEELKTKVETSLHPKRIIVLKMGATVSSYTGIGTIGISAL